METEAVLTSNSSDIRVSPATNGLAPLQGAGTASLADDDRLNVYIDGTEVVVESVRFWVIYASMVRVALFTAEGMYTELDVSIITCVTFH